MPFPPCNGSLHGDCKRHFNPEQFLDILRLVFQRLVIPEMVASELKKLAQFGHDISWLESTDWIEIQQVKHKSQIIPLLNIVDEGKAEAIVLAKETQAGYILIDDLQGRQIAIQLGFTVIGSVGILLKAKQLGHIPNVKSLMDDIINIAQAFIAPKLYSDVLKLAGE
jgi:predicted nucleic acid-binding protein